MASIREFLDKRQEMGLLRALKPLSFRKPGKVVFQDREYTDFSSNDYLGLASHPKLIEASQKASARFGAGSCASRLMTGDSELCHKLEESTARFKKKEAALVFNSGYQANLGIISVLYKEGDAIFCDRLSHASIIDGILLSGARFFRFRHNDAGHLRDLLEAHRNKFKNCLIVTETVFSMDGDKAPLKELVLLKEKYDCSLMADEAHATGIFGANGSGLVAEEGLSGKVDLIMGTFSKALGGFGAYLAASKEIKEYLVNTCRSFIYSTALPPSVIASNIAAIGLVKDEPFRRKKLLEMSLFFREALLEKGFSVRGDSQIIPVIIGENIKAKDTAWALQKKGYWVLPIWPPTVPEGEARLRFSLTFDHDRDILERLVSDLAAL